jgi:regulation of enolase protein 1 (concanavalin A-like superfamily)
MRDVEGDFAVTVKVCGTLHPTAAGTAGKALSFQAGGLLVWDNKDNYARFVRSGQNLDGTFRPVVAWTVRAGGKKGLNPQTVNVPEQDVYLHLERRGRQLAASYSLDGQNWTPLQTFQGLIGSKVSVGVVALNAAQQPMSVRFEGLRFGK